MGGEDEIVEEAFGCPRCGERRSDFLEIDGNEVVQCLTCGLAYSLNESEIRGGDDEG